MAAHLAGQLNGHEPEKVIRSGHAQGPAGDALGGMIAADVACILPDDFLVKVDRASMACSLEVRAPFLDATLVDWVQGLPATFKLAHGAGHYHEKYRFEDGAWRIASNEVHAVWIDGDAAVLSGN